MSEPRESLIVLADSQESTRAISDRTTIVNQPFGLAKTQLARCFGVVDPMVS